MASRKSSRAAGGSPSPGSKRETKHGGSKNGKKEGLSGSSFFTWFMVIALLGVWTSVAVVWFELVDYEEVLGKLGIYDADGDGDFDVEDAKVLLGLKERSVPAQPTPPESEETVQAAEKSYVESEHKTADVELEDESQSVLHETLHSQPGERHEDVDESISDQWQVKEEIHGETFEAPTTDDMHRGLENEMPEAYETPDSIQKDADLLADGLEAVESEPYEVPASDDYVVSMEGRVNDPEAPGDSEVVLEDAMEHYTEPKHEKQTETQDTAIHDLPEEVNEATEPDKVTEDFDVAKDVSGSKQSEDDVAIEPEESEIPVQAEDYSNDVRVGKSEKETEQDKTEKAKKKKPKLLNKFDKTIKAELDAAEKLRKKGKVEEALRAFEALVNRYPQSPRARYGKAQSEDDLAEKMRSNEMLQQAINTYDEVVSLPNVPSDLIKLSLKREADRQQFLGRMRGSLVTLQKLVQLFPSDTSFKNDLGVGYLLIGDNSNAKKVYEEVLSLAPNDGFAKVHYGFILKAENKIAESIPYLQEGLESGDPGTDDGRFYFHLGDALQRMGDKEAYKWYELGYQRGHFASVWQRSLYNVKGLKAQPWWTARETGYTELVKSLEKNWKLIRDEGLAVMDKKSSLFLPEDENLREKGDWSQFTLWQQGRKNENACKSVPKTCALLERFPEATGCRRGQIKYSIMHPGTHVWPHTGPTNCRLRMHLGLVIPKEGCRIRCAQENRAWEEGKVLIFDDSFEHEVWQDAENYRLIFIVDVWHPELTAQQRRTLPAI
ncbi:PREDICTED: aspartyl/asparaginyl beta-hydroxylase isoform X2 [Lepidothrix coronata]|uniref:Aspartyl/asparaginyl beta-hydroxylase isoform X2 n=1 Tax=Lepidothrix coronata TaxID=321398 RepID=A0A6J0IEG8_9PASS|nr:PREDICTED: aspartyl/asparaginyl beta-hydroxylase isoform X2 [Lepidothrix coronata]